MPGKRRCYSPENSYYDETSDEDFAEGKFTGESSNHSNGSSNDQPCRRGRAPSKRPAPNKNALLARQNRQKKKEYVERLETELKKVRQQNQKQYDFLQKQDVQLKRLSAENIYLRSVLKNKTTITSLLTSMNTILSKEKSQKVSQCNTNENKMAASRIDSGASSISHIDTTLPTTSNEGINVNTSITGHTVPDADGHSYSLELCPKNLSNIQGDNGANAPHSPAHFESSSDLDLLDLSELDLLNLDKDFDNDFLNEISEADSDLFRDNLENEGNLLDNLGDSGVCFHVNSNKVSMEFCTVCNLNSVNSDEPI